MHRYEEVYPAPPLLESKSRLLRFDYLEVHDCETPYQTYQEHLIAVNLGNACHQSHFRDGEHMEFVVNPNEVVLIPCGVKNSWKTKGAVKAVIITLTPDKLASFAQWELGITLAETQLRDLVRVVDDELAQLAVRLKDALKNTFGTAVIFESYACIFLVKLLQKYGIREKEHCKFTKHFTAAHFKTALDYIRANISRPISIEDLSKQVAMSPDYFGKLFKQAIGLSPYKYIMAYRIEQAKVMLAKKYLSLSEISQYCGFSDHAHFSRSFKQHTGCSPKEWRNAL